MKHIELQADLLSLMRAKNYTPKTLPQLIDALGLSHKFMPKLRKAMEALLAEGSAAKVKGDRYGATADLDLVAGVISFRQNGKAYITLADGKTLEVRPQETGVALNGDKVLARVLPDSFKPRRGRNGKKNWDYYDADAPKKFAKVIRILDRSNTKVVGTLRRSYNFWHVVPDDPRFYYDVIVYDPSKEEVSPEPKENDKVVVELNDWVQRHINPTGRIIENLGQSHTPMAEYRGILAKYNLSETFPAEVEHEAKSVSNSVSEADRKGRFDARDIPTITIDPEDAKDFDDAISLRELSNGDVEVGIHIADVSHYVRAGSLLDKEAARRGNSTYLVGTVIPMLPVSLSNGICSLVENEERLVKSVFITFDSDVKTKNVRFANSVIKSSKRLSYEQAFALMSDMPLEEAINVRPPESYATAYAGTSLQEMSQESLLMLRDILRKLWKIASKLRSNRMNAGSLDLEMPEFKIFCNAEGYADRIEKIDYNESHQLIEEYMLAANEEVARALFGARIPFVSRVHDSPEPERLTDLRADIEPFGIRCGDLTNRREVIKTLAEIAKHPQAYILKTMFLRSMKRALYRAECDGHYGLAKHFYAHFTSPIRRYADLTVHRCFDFMLFSQGKETAPTTSPSIRTKAELDLCAEDISRTEEMSTEAERESQKIKLLEYFERRMGKGNAFEAVITSLTNHGFFVELTQSMAYGFVHLRTMSDDIYRLDDDAMALRGRKGRAFAIGDRIYVDVESVDRFKRQIDFRLADNIEQPPSIADSEAFGQKVGYKMRPAAAALAGAGKRGRKGKAGIEDKSPKRKSKNFESNKRNKGKKKKNSNKRRR